MPSSRAPSPRGLGAVEIAGLVQEHAEVERGVGVACPLGALVGCDRALDISAPMQHDSEVQGAAGGAARVESAEFPLLGLGRGHRDAGERRRQEPVASGCSRRVARAMRRCSTSSWPSTGTEAARRQVRARLRDREADAVRATRAPELSGEVLRRTRAASASASRREYARHRRAGRHGLAHRERRRHPLSQARSARSYPRSTRTTGAAERRSRAGAANPATARRRRARRPAAAHRQALARSRQRPAQLSRTQVLALRQPLGQVIAIRPSAGEIDDAAAHAAGLQIGGDACRAPRPARSQSSTTDTYRPASSCAHSGSQASSPGTAIAGSPRERALIMSGGPSTSTTHWTIRRAGVGDQPQPRAARRQHLRRMVMARRIPQDSAQPAGRVADRDDHAVRAPTRTPARAGWRETTRAPALAAAPAAATPAPPDVGSAAASSCSPIASSRDLDAPGPW